MDEHSQVPYRRSEKGTGTFRSTVLNMCNNIVGAGLLSLPSTLKEASLVGGILSLSCIAIFSSITFIMVAIVCRATGEYTYKGLGAATLGNRFGTITQVVMFCYTAVSCLSYLILCCDFVAGDKGIATWWCTNQGTLDNCNPFIKLFTYRLVVISFFSIFLLLPLSLKKNLSALKYTSFLSFLGMLYIMGLNMGYFVGKVGKVENVSIFQLDSGIFSSIPVMNVAFIAHYNAPRYYEELEDRTLKQYSKCVIASLGICLFVYSLTAIFGYLNFGNAVNSDVLVSFDGHFVPAVVGRFAMLLVVLFTYPLAFNSLRASLISLLHTFQEPLVTTDEALPAPTSASKLSTKSFRVITVVLLLITVSPAIVLHEIGVVLSYKGALLGGFIAYGFPGMMFLSLVNHEERTRKNSSEVDFGDEHHLLSTDDEAELQDVDSSTIQNGKLHIGLSLRKIMFLKVFSYFLVCFTVVTGILGAVLTYMHH